MIPKFRAWDERAGLTEVISIDLLEKNSKLVIGNTESLIIFL